MDSLTISPIQACESLAYLRLEEEAFPASAHLVVPAGYEAVVWKNPYDYTLRYPGAYPLRGDLPERRIRIGRSELTGRVGFLNKRLKYTLYWGTGTPIAYSDPELLRCNQAGFSGSLTLKLDMSEVFLKRVSMTGEVRASLKELAAERLPAFSLALNRALLQEIERRELSFRGIARGLAGLTVATAGRVREAFLTPGLWMDDFLIENCVFPDLDESLF